MDSFSVSQIFPSVYFVIDFAQVACKIILGTFFGG